MKKITFLIAVFFFEWVARHFNMLFGAHMIISWLLLSPHRTHHVVYCLYSALSVYSGHSLG
jgi:hypothetical protein